MAFSDPQTITIDGTAINLNRVSTGENQSKYTSSDGLVSLSASHAYNRRTRRVLRLDHAKITSDPFIPSENRKVSMSTYMVFDVPTVGYTNDEVGDIYTGFNSLYTASTSAMITDLLGGES